MTETITHVETSIRTITIDLFHDTACPWCRIGHAHVRRALAGWDGPPVEIRWHPFQLAPDIPREGKDFRTHLGGKFGDDMETIFAQVSRAGEGAGLRFAWDKVDRAPNTVLSHMFYDAVPITRRDDIVERTYTAYFEQGRDIGKPETLIEIAREAGLTPDEISHIDAALGRDDLRERILAEARAAAEMGVSGVPLFVFDGAAVISGAQPPDVLRTALARVVAARAESTPSVE